jgi:HEAT repeat protein
VPSIDSQSLHDRAAQAAQQQHWAAVLHDLQLVIHDRQLQLSVEQLAQPTHRGESWLSLALDVLEWGDFQDRWDVAKLLPHFGAPAIAALLELLSDESAHPEAQWFAVRILGNADHPDIIPTLLQVVQQADTAELQMVAANALAQIGPTVLPAIAPLIQEPQTKRLGSKILSQIRHSETVPYLLELAKDDDAQVRAIAVEALGSFHGPVIAQILQVSLRDYATPVRSAAIAAIGFCLADLPNVDWVAQIAPLLSDLNLDVGRQAAAVLGKIGSPTAIATLVTTLRSPHPPEPLAIAIVRAIGYIDRPDAVQTLVTIWSQYSLSLNVRLELCRVLGQVESPASQAVSLPILLDWLATDAQIAQHAALKQAIVLAIGELGHITALEPLIQQLRDPDPRVRLHIVAALKRLAIDQGFVTLQDWQSLHPPDSPLGQGIAMAIAEW